MTAKAKYGLTPEHEAQLKPWANKWIANAMSTKPMDDEDRAAMRAAIRGLYQAANLKPPPEHRIVFVPSPFVLRFAAGFAAAIWYLRKTRAATDAATADATDAATYAATADATAAATRAATYDATYAATADATDAATYDATDAATYAATAAATADATAAATRAATYAATRAATRAATDDATAAATYDATAAATYAATADATAAATDAATDDATAWYLSGDFVACAKAILRANWKLGILCSRDLYGKMWNGGNQWSAWAAFLSFFRHVAKLQLDYGKWGHYEAAAIHGGPRVMHSDFCMVSDRPAILTVDDSNLPHNSSGPFCQWRDGSKLFAWHGVRVPAEYYLRPLVATQILAEENAEVRRAMIERYDEVNGRGAFINACGAKVLDSAVQPMRLGEANAINELLSVDMPGDPDGRMLYVKMIDPSTGRVYMNRCHPELRPLLGNDKNGRPLLGKPQKLTVQNALASTHGMYGHEYVLEAES